MAVGGPENKSYDELPISLVVHWTEDAGQCEIMANSIYHSLDTTIKERTPAGVVIGFVQLLDQMPNWVGRDEKNIAENVIRANIIYERGV